MPPHEVSPVAAYEAATERAVRTTRALILAEARCLELSQQIADIRAAAATATEDVSDDAVD